MIHSAPEIQDGKPHLLFALSEDDLQFIEAGNLITLCLEDLQRTVIFGYAFTRELVTHPDKSCVISFFKTTCRDLRDGYGVTIEEHGVVFTFVYHRDQDAMLQSLQQLGGDIKITHKTPTPPRR